MTKIIDGKTIAAAIREQIKIEVKEFEAKKGKKPKLAVIFVGDDPASQVYVRNKEKGCADVGMLSEVRRLPSSTKEAELLDSIRQLNNDENVHGILVQIPLPGNLDESIAINAIEPRKDVDGLNTINMGKLLKGEKDGFMPCTAQGVIDLILSTGVELKGKEAVVVGRSNIVGKPTAIMLLQNNATVTVCHSKTNDMGGVIRRAEILVVAVGSPGIVHREMIREGAIVIDVGISRVGEKLVGDVDFEGAKGRAGFITPVPGGVGPMTIARLLKNTLKAAKLLTAY